MRGLTPFVLGILLTLFASTFSFAQTIDDKLLYNKNANAVRMFMHKLWGEHVAWTRNYTTGALAGLGDADVAEKRLMKNQVDIGNAFKPFCGDITGDKLSDLLRAYIKTGTEVVQAARSGDKAAFLQAQTRWHTDVEDIASFMASIIPNLKMSELSTMLNAHIDHVVGEVSSRLEKDWKADADHVDKDSDLMLTFADTITDGIIKQFPDKFPF